MLAEKKHLSLWIPPYIDQTRIPGSPKGNFLSANLRLICQTIELLNGDEMQALELQQVNSASLTQASDSKVFPSYHQRMILRSWKSISAETNTACSFLAAQSKIITLKEVKNT